MARVIDPHPHQHFWDRDKFNYAWQVAYTRFVGTHAEYDRIDVEVV